MTTWQSFLQEHRQQHLDELVDFLRIPSVSSLPAHADDVQRAGQWVADRMATAGIESVRVIPTAGHPVVYGDWQHAPGLPTILIYGHFDTQPVDPLDGWVIPPFEPAIQGDRLYARGASDDKGNMLLPILVVEALLQTEKTLPVNLKFLFEGQEEIGSPQLPGFIEAHKELLACDVVFSADGVQWTEDQPCVFLGFRGQRALQIDVQGPRADLHSGIFGGAVQNPLHALVHILESMHDAEGGITVDGLCDGVRELTDDERAQIAAVPFDEREYKTALGVDELFGEAGYSTYERAWVRPTLEVTGIWGGFQGDGVKAVLPATAHAKISCRLVADQDPGGVVSAFTRHVASHAPAGVTATVTPLTSHAYPYSITADHPGIKAAHEVLEELYGRAPHYVRLGGTLPICSLFLDSLNADTVMFSFGLEDENIHAPNEFLRLSSFDRGLQAYGMLLQRLATVPF